MFWLSSAASAFLILLLLSVSFRSCYLIRTGQPEAAAHASDGIATRFTRRLHERKIGTWQGPRYTPMASSHGSEKLELITPPFAATDKLLKFSHPLRLIAHRHKA